MKIKTGGTPLERIGALFSLLLGAVCASFALEVILLPNSIIDGGVVGISFLLSRFIGPQFFYPLVALLNLPFIYLAARHISRSFVFYMFFAVFAFAFSGFFIEHSSHALVTSYSGDLLEVVVVGGILLGLGIGLIIRSGGCLDGTEILGILLNKRIGVSVGSVVLLANVVIFAIAGLVFQDLHAPVRSLMTFIVAIKIMDLVIMGLEEMKSVMIFSSDPQQVGHALMYQMKFGLTYLEARSGFVGRKTQVIFLMAERLQLAQIRDTVLSIDPDAFIAIENLHEVVTHGNKNIAKKD